MSNIRKRGVAYLHKALGREPSGAVAVSKYFRAEESWTGKATWWFDLLIKKVKNNRRGIYYLLGKKRKSGFVVIGLVVGKFVNSESSHGFSLVVFDQKGIITNQLTTGVPRQHAFGGLTWSQLRARELGLKYLTKV